MVSKAKSTKSTAAPKPKAKTPASKKKVHAISSLHVPPSLTSSFLGYHMIFFFRLLFLCNFIHVSFTLQLFVPLRHTLNIFCYCFSASIVDLSREFPTRCLFPHLFPCWPSLLQRTTPLGLIHPIENNILCPWALIIIGIFK